MLFFGVATLLLSAAGGVKTLCAEALQVPTSNDTTTANGTDESTRAVTSLLTILQQLSWKQVILISDEQGELWRGTDRVLAALSASFRKFSVFHSSVAWQPWGLPAIIKLGPEGATQKSLNVVLVCSLACVTSVLEGARDFETRWRSQTSLRERSRWLIYPTDVTHPKWLDLCNVTMNNVAVMMFRQESDSDLDAQVVTERVCLFTLRWAARGRYLDPVEQDQESGLAWTESLLFPNSKLGLNGKLLRVGMNPDIRFTVETLPNGTTVYGGIDSELLLYFSQYLNFTYEIILAVDRMWGSPLENGSWNGLIGMLQRKELDVVLTPFLRILSRSEAVDYSSTVEYFLFSFVYKRPEPTSFGLMTYLKPFRLEVFGCIAVAVVLTAVLMLFTNALSSGGEENSADHPHVSSKASVGALWNGWIANFSRRLEFTICALFHQGDEEGATSTSHRLLVACWWLLCVALAAAYTGNLVAFLAVPREDFPITSLEDLAHQTDFKFGTIGSAFIQIYFQGSSLPLHRKIWQRMQEFAGDDPDVLHVNDTIHINKALTEKYVFVDSEVSFQGWLFRHCELAVNKKGFGSGDSGLLFQKNSAYEPMFSRRMDILRESGLWGEMTRRWLYQNHTPCNAFSSRANNPASLADVQGALYVLLAGAATAAVVFVGELVLSHIQNRRGKCKIEESAHENERGK